jgi:branched-chain amino acid transport system ATP-binding protein
VTLVVRRGQRHGLIGPNGAGKSTLFNLISGQFAPTSGDILLNGQSIVDVPPYLINRRGLSRSFQITNLFPRMSVAENLRIAVMGHHGHRFTLFRPVANLRRVSSRVDEHLEKLRLQHRRNDMAGDLAYSEQRALEIGMALATDPEILLLDEPTSGMSRDESAYMVELIREVTEGKTLLVVEHDMSVVFDLCDHTSVLVYGQILASGAPETVRADRRVQEAYLGEEAA